MPDAKLRRPTVNLDNLEVVGGSFAYRKREVPLDPEDPGAGTVEETDLLFDLRTKDESGEPAQQRIVLSNLDIYADDDTLDPSVKADIAGLHAAVNTLEKVLIPTVLRLLKAKQYEQQS